MKHYDIDITSSISSFLVEYQIRRAITINETKVKLERKIKKPIIIDYKAPWYRLASQRLHLLYKYVTFYERNTEEQ